MKKHFLIIFFIIIFLFCPIIAKANFGDLRYEVTDVNISNSNITFKGWAYIHKTNNYINVENSEGKIVKENGDQKIIIQAYIDDKLIDTSSNNIIESKMPNYNFYCELFYRGGRHTSCIEKDYLNISYNSCGVNKDDGSSQCYYEDIYFDITFDISKWNVNSTSKVSFKIAVSNADFEKKITKLDYDNALSYKNDVYTSPETVSIADASISNYSNDYITIDKGSVATTVKFIANSGLLLKPNDLSQKYKYNGGASCTYGAWNDGGKIYNKCYGNVYDLYVDDSLNYPDGRSSRTNNEKCLSFLGSNCKGTYFYAIKVKKKYTNLGYTCSFACPCSGTDCNVAVARGSHVKPTGTFKINIKNDKKCVVTNPLPNKLNCNSSGELSSVCKELTVNTSEGRAEVKIEQTGTLSSVMTPDSIYAGGGFKFGIMYYNNIKWSYVNGKPNSKLHAAVNNEMNKKIKSYESYIAGINVENLKFDNSLISSGMVKKCTSSSENKNYYGSEGITVSCVFTFPDSTIDYNGNLIYTSISSSSLNINNRYYTPIDKFGNFVVSARVTGMSRITDASSRSDSADKNNKPWTGVWTDDIEGCEISLYPLFYSEKGMYNFIYRPIDIFNPFPNRNAGINWFDWYNVNSNRKRLEDSYSSSSLEYRATLNNETITNIKNYNKNNNYLNWDSIDENTGDSSFITNYNYIDRVGGN